MKSINYLPAIFVCLLLFAGCSSDDNDPAATLEVLESNVTFSASNGEGTIKVSENIPFEAKVDQTWCIINVEGNVINVSVPSNLSLESRTALVTITSEGDPLYVPVTQFGSILAIDNQLLLFPEEGGRIAIPYKSTLPLEITYDAGWLKHEIEKDSVVFTTAKAEVLKQNTTVKVVSGDRSREFKVEQIGLIGNYELTYTTKEEVEDTLDVSITRGEGKYDFMLNGMPYDKPLAMKYSESGMAISAGQSIGKDTETGFFIFLMVGKHSSNSFTYINTVSMTAEAILTEDDNLEMAFKNNGSWTTTVADSFRYHTYTSETPSYMGSKDELLRMVNPVLKRKVE